MRNALLAINIVFLASACLASCCVAGDLRGGGFRLPPPPRRVANPQEDAVPNGDDISMRFGSGECEEPVEDSKPDAPKPWRLFRPECTSPWEVGGWFQRGYHEHTTPLSEIFADGHAFNDAPHRINLHQAWLYLERTTDEDLDYDWGFRADLVYGIDAQDTQAFGSNGWDNSFDHGTYGWAIPQMYLTFVWDKLEIKAGHFFTLLGYEGVTAPSNFFYSHSLTSFNTEPFTHTGAVATYQLSEQVDVVGGWINGWDSGPTFSNGANAGLTGLQWTPVEELQIAYYCTFGDFGNRGHNGYSHSFVAQALLTEKLKYVLQSDLLNVMENSNSPSANRDDDIGVNQYLFYDYCAHVKLGTRLEWWKCDGVSYQEVTAGINWMPQANMTVRPELRYDWSTGGTVDQTTFAIDSIFTY